MAGNTLSSKHPEIMLPSTSKDIFKTGLLK